MRLLFCHLFSLEVVEINAFSSTFNGKILFKYDFSIYINCPSKIYVKLNK